MITVVVSPTDLEGPELTLAGARYRHLFRARRLQTGVQVRLVDGAGVARFGRVESIHRTEARLVPTGLAPTGEPSRYVELLAPIPKGGRLSWMVEKCTEVGVSALRLLQTDRAPREVGVGTLERLGRVATAAVEQCHRSVVPAISGPHRFRDLLELLESLPARRFLQPGGQALQAPASTSRTALLVGPEGGWTPGEIERLEGLQCESVGLGPATLRIETAAVAGCALLLLSEEAQERSIPLTP